MKCALICCLILFLCSESRTLDINLKRCVSSDSKVVMFSCRTQSELGTNEWNCGNNYDSSVEQPYYKCNSEYRDFSLNDRILKDHLQPERLDIAFLEIERFELHESFQSNTITTFFARNNQLNNISSLISMPNLKEMDLSHNNFSSLSKEQNFFGFFVRPEQGIFGSFPQLKSLDLSYNQISTIDRNHFEHCNQLKWLNLSNNQLKLLYDFFESLQNIIDIDLSSNLIDHSYSSPFENARKLTKINLSNNSIEFFAFGAFKDLTELNYLNLSHNQMPSISENAFGDNGKLIDLDLSNSGLISLSPNNFNGADNLEKINLSHNTMGEIEPKAFLRLRDLHTLDLSSNQIEKIDKNTFKYNIQLRSLNLRNNPLKDFNHNAFSASVSWIDLQLPWTEIQQLDISCNTSTCAIDALQEGKEFTNLQSINASGNQVVNIPKLLSHLGSKITRLDLSYTNIETLNSNMLQKFKDLNEINLRNAIKSKIDGDAFRYQTQLERLDISDNNLKNLTSIFGTRHFNELAILYSENNGLSSLEIISKERFPKLRVLTISGNNFTCGYLRDFLNKWDKNQLKVIENGKEVPLDVNKIGCHEEVTTQASTTTTTTTTSSTTTTTTKIPTTTPTTKKPTKTTTTPAPPKTKRPPTTTNKSTEPSTPKINITKSPIIQTTTEHVDTESTENFPDSSSTTPANPPMDDMNNQDQELIIIIRGPMIIIIVVITVILLIIIAVVVICIIRKRRLSNEEDYELPDACFHRKRLFKRRNRPVESIYDEPIYQEPIYDYDNARDSVESAQENAGQFNHNNRAQMHQGDEDELTYEEMYVTQEQVEMNIMNEVRFPLFGTKGANYPNSSNHSNRPTQPNHSNRFNVPSHPNEENNQNQLGNQSYDHLEFPTEEQ